MDSIDGQEGGDCGTEDVVAYGGVIFFALFEVLVPSKEEYQEFWLGEVAGPWGEEVPDVSPPGSGQPGAVYVNHLCLGGNM